MMNASELKAKIHTGIGDQWAIPQAHGVDLRRCLVGPLLLEYYHPGEKIPEKLWLVLEEHPERQDKGYAIVYNEQRDTFGLAVGKTCIGYYGSFMETLRAM